MRISDWSSDVCSSDLFPANVRKLGHVPTADHNAFNTTPLAVLNIARDSMAATGYSPAPRVFEAAGAAACIITDAWEGIDLFLDPEAKSWWPGTAWTWRRSWRISSSEERRVGEEGVSTVRYRGCPDNSKK